MRSLFLFHVPFASYGTEHLSWLLAGTISTYAFISMGKKQPDDVGKRRVGLIISLFPLLLWFGIALYEALFFRPVNLEIVLPFHACYFLNMLMPVLLWQRSYFLFEVSYFMVMGGCIQALFTPDLQTSFPDHINVRYFVVHMCLVQSILYAIFVFGFRPTWKSFGKAFLWANIYFLFVIGINLLLGTNFMFLRRKPTTPTMLDLFGEWPWYIFGGELLALVLFTLVMLPFAVRKKANNWTASHSNGSIMH